MVVSGTCRNELWVSEAISGTEGAAELIAVLDRDYVMSEGGQWSEAGYTVPSNSIFWTDLFGNVAKLPKGVKVIRIQGGWGVYRNSVPYIVPRPNGGGRYMRICESNLVATVSAPVSATVTPSTVMITHTCVSRIEMGVIVGKADFTKEYNSFFEGRGFAFGGSVQPGGKVPVGSFFLGTFSSIPTGVADLKGGFLWEVTKEIVAPNGGRWMRICK